MQFKFFCLVATRQLVLSAHRENLSIINDYLLCSLVHMSINLCTVKMEGSDKSINGNAPRAQDTMTTTKWQLNGDKEPPKDCIKPANLNTPLPLLLPIFSNLCVSLLMDLSWIAFIIMYSLIVVKKKNIYKYIKFVCMYKTASSSKKKIYEKTGSHPAWWMRSIVHEACTQQIIVSDQLPFLLPTVGSASTSSLLHSVLHRRRCVQPKRRCDQLLEPPRQLECSWLL